MSHDSLAIYIGDYTGPEARVSARRSAMDLPCGIIGQRRATFIPANCYLAVAPGSGPGS